MLPAPLARRAAVAGLLAALALPAGAQAAKLDQPLKPCYVSAGNQREPIRVLASGFTPERDRGRRRRRRPVHQRGGPRQRPRDRRWRTCSPLRRPTASGRFTLTVTERDLTGNTVSTTSRVTALAVDTRPARARPSRRVTFSGRGFTGAGPVWAHYVFADAQRRPCASPSRAARAGPSACAAADAHPAPAHGHVDAAGRPAALLRADAGHQRLPDQHHGRAHAALAVAAHYSPVPSTDPEVSRHRVRRSFAAAAGRLGPRRPRRARRGPGPGRPSSPPRRACAPSRASTRGRSPRRAARPAASSPSAPTTRSSPRATADAAGTLPAQPASGPSISRHRHLRADLLAAQRRTASPPRPPSRCRSSASASSCRDRARPRSRVSYRSTASSPGQRRLPARPPQRPHARALQPRHGRRATAARRQQAPALHAAAQLPHGHATTTGSPRAAASTADATLRALTDHDLPRSARPAASDVASRGHRASPVRARRRGRAGLGARRLGRPRRHRLRRRTRLNARSPSWTSTEHLVAVGVVALEDPERERVDEVALDDALQRPRPVGRVVAEVARAASAPRRTARPRCRARTRARSGGRPAGRRSRRAARGSAPRTRRCRRAG